MRTVICCVLGAVLLIGCGRVEVRPRQSDDGSGLERLQPQAPDLVESVKKFYQALQAKDWATTYDMRTATFKQDVIRGDYLAQLAKENPRLSSYRVLGVEFFQSPNGGSAAELIMDFDHGASYRCARWKKVNGSWLCDDPGLGGFLRSLRIPDWATH